MNDKKGAIVSSILTNPSITTTSIIIPPPSLPPLHGKYKKDLQMDVDKMMFTRKVDLDYIPGLDDDLKVILPGT